MILLNQVYTMEQEQQIKKLLTLTIFINKTRFRLEIRLNLSPCQKKEVQRVLKQGPKGNKNRNPPINQGQSPANLLKALPARGQELLIARSQLPHPTKMVNFSSHILIIIQASRFWRSNLDSF